MSAQEAGVSPRHTGINASVVSALCSSPSGRDGENGSAFGHAGHRPSGLTACPGPRVPLGRGTTASARSQPGSACPSMEQRC